MDEPLQIIYRNMEENTAISSFIEEKTQKIEKLFNRTTCCHVTVEKTQKTKEPAGVYRVRVELSLPQRNSIIIKKEAKISSTFPHLTALIGSALNAATTEVERLKEKKFSPERREKREF